MIIAALISVVAAIRQARDANFGQAKNVAKSTDNLVEALKYYLQDSGMV